MSPQPAKVLLVTERPLLALTFRELLETAGWNTAHVLLRPEELATSVGPETAALAMIDGRAGLSWQNYADLCSRAPRSRFVVWCEEVTPQSVQAAIESGVHGLLSVRLAAADAAQALIHVWQGERQFRFDGEFQTRPAAEPGLTPREQDVVALVMQGRRNREIAESLHTTEGSVKVYINRIFSKTGAKSRHELALAGPTILRRKETGARAARVHAAAADPFDAVWMLTGGPSNFRSSGEVSYDSIKR